MTDNAFERFWALGYTRLIPIVPPDAPISEHSTLFKRVGTKQDGRGKTPGTRGRDGKWTSFDWAAYESEAPDLPRWHGMGAGVGIKTGDVVALDADTLQKPFAAIIRDIVEAQIGRTPIRVGQFPKALYLFRTTEPIPYMRVEFGPRDERGNAERVELLTEGRQFVAEGIHPKTGKPYMWPKPIVPFDELPLVTPAQIETLMAALRQALPEASKLITEGGAKPVEQAALTGDLDAVTKAVNALPNTSNHFPSRESYRDVGYAIKAALPHNEPEALALFQDWCARWTDGENEPDVVEADWRRMKPPYRRGASWLYEIAEQYGHFDRAEAWFTPIDDADLAPNPFQEIATKGSTDVYPMLTMGEIITRPPPTFLIEQHILDVSIGFLYSDPGAGKSFLALDAALHIAYGLPDWHGHAIHAPPDAMVLYLAAEGSRGFRNRVKAWMLAHNETIPSDRFRLIEKTINFMEPGDVDKLLRTARSVAGLRPCLIIVDTVSRALPGSDENLQKEMTLFVNACDRLRDAFGCSVMGVHHANKAGEMRGSTVLKGGGDFVFQLTRKPGATIGTLLCEKLKDDEDGWSEPYRFEKVQIGEGQSSLVPSREELSVGPSTVLTPAVTVAVLNAMKAAWEEGQPWATSSQSGERRALKRMVADFGFAPLAADELLNVWQQTGVIERAMVDTKSKRMGFHVLVIPDLPDAGVFD